LCINNSFLDQIHWPDLKGKDTWYKGVMGRWNAYGQSKTANLLFAVELNRKMHSEGFRITANAVHPGVIKTELGRDLGP
jgi:NAD(P)-dependent dehydrogenase (short-subunit alcohol dehydrogenase family)